MIKNSIFIVIDAMRNYESNQDERGRQKVINKLKLQEFNLIDGLCVSAPSSVMSCITMLTGKPAYNQYPNYTKINLKKSNYKTITQKLKDKGINRYGILYYREMRELLKSEYPIIQNKFMISSSANLKERWSNEFIYKQVNHLIKNDLLNEPFHLMLWFNSRDDIKTSFYVEETLKSLRENINWDKTLVIVTGDHGYPDKRRGFTSDGSDLKKVGLSHDLIMTDDNLIVPFAFKYGNKNLESFISKGFYKQELMYELTNIFYDRFNKTDLKNIFVGNHINKNNLYIGDSRFFLQKNRATTIRTDNQKLIIYPNNTCEFYDLDNDPLEEKKKLVSINKLDYSFHSLYNFYLNAEKKDFNLWSKKYKDLMNKKLKNSKLILKLLKKQNSIKIKVIGSKIFEKLLIKEFQNNFTYSDKYELRKIIILDDIRLKSNFKEVINHFRKGDIILDSELNIIGGIIATIITFYKTKYIEAWKRYLYRISIQPNLYFKLKEFINTLIFLIRKK